MDEQAAENQEIRDARIVTEFFRSDRVSDEQAGNVGVKRNQQGDESERDGFEEQLPSGLIALTHLLVFKSVTDTPDGRQIVKNQHDQVAGDQC